MLQRLIDCIATAASGCFFLAYDAARTKRPEAAGVREGFPAKCVGRCEVYQVCLGPTTVKNAYILRLIFELTFQLGIMLIVAHN